MKDRLHQIPTSPTLAINQTVKDMHLLGEKVYRFGFGESPFSPPSFIVEALQAHAAKSYYGQVQGELELRKAVAAFHHQAQGLSYTADDVLIAPGSKILLFAIMASFTAADVLIPQPAWVSYAPQARLCGHNSIAIPCTFEGRWRVTPQALRTAIAEQRHEQSILILNHPGNPDGMGYTQAELEALTEVCRDHDILVLSDEIYALLAHSGTHVPLATVYPEGTITTTGLSKWCGAGGWRLGVALLPPTISQHFKKTLLGVCSETYSCTSQPIQAAAIAAYASYDEIRPFLDHQKRILKQIANCIFQELSASEVRMHPSEGGFYFFPDFSAYADRLARKGIKDSKSLCEHLLKDTGVALLPASAFGCDPHLLAARLAYVDFKPPQQLEDFELEVHAAHLQEGIQKMLQWLEGV